MIQSRSHLSLILRAFIAIQNTVSSFSFVVCKENVLETCTGSHGNNVTYQNKQLRFLADLC